MPNDTLVQPMTPTPSAAPIAAPSAPPNIDPNAPTSVPSVSTLDPSQVTPQGTTEYQPVAQAGAAVSQAVNTPITPSAPDRHARLMNMIQGLAVGLSAAGTSIGTGGKEGGAKEVADIQAQQQQQKLAQQQQAQAARNADIQQKIQAFSVAQQQFDNHMNLLTLGDKMTQEHLKTLDETQKQIGQEQDIRTKAWQDFLQTGDWNNYQDTLGKLGATTGATSGTPGTVPPMATTTWKSAVDSAAQAYPDDAVIKQQQAVFQNPQAGPQEQAMAARMAANRQSALDNAAKSQKLQGDAAEATTKAGTMNEDLARTIATAPTGRYNAAQTKQANDYIASVNRQKLDAVTAGYVATGKGTEAMYKNGVDPTTKERLTLANAPDEFMVDARTGQPIPTAMLSTLKPTQQENNRADFAKSTLHTLDIVDNLKKQGKLPNGPITGLTEQQLAKAGVSSADAQLAISLISLAQSSATGAHVGGRFNSEIMDKMSHLLNLNMNDSQFQGAEEGMRDVMQPYAEQGGRETVAQFRQSLIGKSKVVNGKSYTVTGFDDKGQVVLTPTGK